MVIGAFDTKSIEYKFLIDLLRENGCEVITVNTGVLGSTDLFQINIPAEEIAIAGGTDLETLRNENDRGKAIQVMSDGSAKVIEKIFSDEKFDGIIGMGGTAGTNVVTSAMRVLPFGVPKICVSTVASGDVSPYLQTSDIILIPSLTDVAGINSLSKVFFYQCSGCIDGYDKYE